MIKYRKPIEDGKNLIFEINQCRSLELVSVDGGSFAMGSDIDEHGRSYDEASHPVSFSKDYLIAKYPVTRQQYAAVTGAPVPDYNEKDLPQEGITWEDAVAFCDLLNSHMAHVLPPGYRFDLPTEAQWEFAARGGRLSRNCRYSGGDEIDDVAWYNDNSGFASHPVGLKRPNELGLYDMSGNIREWCKDYYAQYRPSSVTNPAGPELGLERVQRGGGYDDVTALCRCAARDSRDPADGTSAGFRVALVPVDAPESFDEADFARAVPLQQQPAPRPVPRPVRREEIVWNNATLYLASDLKMEMRILQSGRIQVERSAPHDGTWRVQHIPADTAFFIAKYLVTQDLYERVTGFNPSEFRGANLPVENVSWFDAMAFCKRLNELSAGKLPNDFEFTLPEQHFWEYAATGGCHTDRVQFCGWYAGNSGGETHEVGRKSGNLLGIFDMRGNVWEWCRNNASVDEFGDPLKESERGQTPRKAIMGGGWNSSEEVCLFQDLGRKPETKSSEIGFRVILRPREGLRMQFGYPPIEKIGQFFMQKDPGTCENGILVLPGHIPLPTVKIPHGVYTTQNTVKRPSFERRIIETVPLTQDCWIGQYPITQQQFEEVMGFNPSFFKGPYRPVESVTLKEALEFCRRLNKITEGIREPGYNYALPKYITLKLACCGAAGSAELNDVAWFRENAGGETHDVGRKSPNLLGVFDYLGNVAEWCGNLCKVASDGTIPDEAAVRSGKCGPLQHGAVVFGGSWKTPRAECDFDQRGLPVDARSSAVGFRIILTYIPQLDPTEEPY